MKTMIPLNGSKNGSHAFTPDSSRVADPACRNARCDACSYNNLDRCIAS